MGAQCKTGADEHREIAARPERLSQLRCTRWPQQVRPSIGDFWTATGLRERSWHRVIGSRSKRYRGALTVCRRPMQKIAIEVETGRLLLPWCGTAKAEPLFGVMAVKPCPSAGRVTSVIPGPFGGNIDNRLLRPGGVLGSIVREFEATVPGITAERVPSVQRIADRTGQFSLLRDQLQLVSTDDGGRRARVSGLVVSGPRPRSTFVWTAWRDQSAVPKRKSRRVRHRADTEPVPCGPQCPAE